MKLRHVEITVMNFIILLILYIIKFRDFNFRVSFILRVLIFAIFSNLELAKLSKNKVPHESTAQ